MQRKKALFCEKSKNPEQGGVRMSLRTPALRNQVIILPELLSERVERGPHAARFFLYLANELDINLYRVPR
jgi:hypothetical protein